MRVKALITLTLLALILPACATTPADRQNVRTPEELDYMLKVHDIAVSHKNYNETYADVLSTKNTNLIYHSTLRNIDRVQSTIDELRAMTPPVRYSEFHQKFMKVFEKDILAFSYMKKGSAILLGLEKGTEDDAVKYINMSRDTTLEVNNLMDEAKAIWPK